MTQVPQRQPRAGFDPAPYERELRAILGALARDPDLDPRALDRLLRLHPKDGRGFFSKSELLAGLRRFGAEGALDARAVEARLRLRPVRSLSGVTPVTLLTRPHPCPGECIFCPNDVRMPKSYLSAEPGAQRAEDNRFDPYLQTWSRLAAYREIGHPTDKVELIVLGGTWSFHPERYQRGFAAGCFAALNDFGGGVDRRAGRGAELPAAYASLPRSVDGVRGAYNRRVHDLFPDAGEDVSWDELARLQRANESAECRSVGLSVETRPDHVDAAELERIRRLGATKVQIGIQSLRDDVLERNRRGHDVEASRRAIRLLRGAGFKIQAHWMPNLLGATPEDDARDFARLFEDPDFRPDELKIYPCHLVESAELAVHHRSGAWRAYADAELVELLTACLEAAPRYCRITRVIRDFSAGDIVAGTHTANLREVAERRLRARGGRCRDVRAREVRTLRFRADALRLREERYATSIGEEHFLEWVTPQDRLAAFLRLSLPREPAPLAELAGAALVRELHVYGAALGIGHTPRDESQHRGLGRTLLDHAARCARTAGFHHLAVISAIGTRPYYRTQGFQDGDLYQHKPV